MANVPQLDLACSGIIIDAIAVCCKTMLVLFHYKMGVFLLSKTAFY